VPGPHTPPDFWGLLRALREHEVDFVTIGGFAVTLHGYVRATKDIDVVPAPDRENLSRLWDALCALDATPAEFGDFDPEELRAPFTPAGLGGGNWVLYTRLGRLDLMLSVQDEDGELPYADLRGAAQAADFAEAGGTVWFASAAHLIAMNEHAADVIRESVRAVAQELMEAEISELVGAGLGGRGLRIARRIGTAVGPADGTPVRVRSSCRSPSSRRCR
jgi:hypothetical protein